MGESLGLQFLESLDPHGSQIALGPGRRQLATRLEHLLRNLEADLQHVVVERAEQLPGFNRVAFLRHERGEDTGFGGGEFDLAEWLGEAVDRVVALRAAAGREEEERS